MQVRQPSLDRAILYSGLEGERVVGRCSGVSSLDVLLVVAVMAIGSR